MICRMIEERGNGFPSVGDHVSDGDGVYQVHSVSRIQTAQWEANWVFAELDRVGSLDSWDEEDDGEIYPVRVEAEL